MGGILILSLLFSLNLGAFELQTSDLKDFAFDGCTSSPDGYWAHCCYEHDILYWAGGSFSDRLFADDRLKTCMNKIDGPGYVYYDFVRAAGFAYWSGAWPNRNKRPVEELTEDEIEMILAEKRVCEATGNAGICPRPIFENTITPALTEEQIQLVTEKFRTTVFNSNQYQEFLRVYRSQQGEEPATTEFH